MKKYRILITGVGTIIGYGIINSLKKSNYNVEIWGMDMNVDAIGKNWCDNFIEAIPASSDEFIDFLKKTITDNNIDLVFLGTEQELKKIASSKVQLAEFYKKIVINSDSIIAISRDKWLTYNFLISNTIQVIDSYIEGSYTDLSQKLGNKFLLKPRSSYSSRGVVIVEDKESFDYYKKRLGDQFLAQRYIGDNEHEYTASTFAFGDGTCITPIIMRRKLSYEGSTVEAIIEFIPKLNDEIKKLVTLLKPIGPTNFQYRMENNKFYLLETNPRISSATSLRTAFGYNEAEMCIRFFLEGERINDVLIKKGKALRYISDYVELT
ncbi:MAG: ATP-grasp domain-containing protein [Saccharofermentanales bacterium]